MPGRLEGRRIAFLTANEGVEQVELTQPWDAVRAGAEPRFGARRSRCRKGVRRAEHQYPR